MQILSKKIFSALVLFMGVVALIVLSAAPQPAHAHPWDWFGWGKRVTGSAVVKTETRAVSGYKGVKLSGSFHVTVVQNGSEGVTIVADDNLLPLISTEVERGNLYIKWSERNLNVSHQKITITVHAKDIDELSVAGSGNIVADVINTPRLRSAIAGSGDINIKNLTSDALKISIDGSGNFGAGGLTNEFEVSISGSGGVKIASLKTKNAKLSIAGSGDATLWATDTLKVSLAGSGDIRYYGGATLTKSVAGSGSIKRLGAAPNR